MKKITIILLTLFVVTVISCQRSEEEIPSPSGSGEVLKTKPNPIPVPAGAPLTQTEIDKKIKTTLEDNHAFTWDMVDLTYIWSAAQYRGQVIAVGYKPAGEDDITERIHQVNVREGEWKQVHDAIIALVVSEVNATADPKITAADIIVEDDPVLPILTFTLTDRNAITRLYNLENIRYIEPLDYWPQDPSLQVESGEGCSGSGYALNGADYTTIAPNCKLPWNFSSVNIPAAWNTAEGAGIKIGVIDAGISSTQTMLGSQFNNGYSNVGRTVTYDYTYGSSAFNTCTHGTSMSGLAVGPRNDQGTSTGVAYKSSLHFIRACADVLLDASSEKTGVKNACVRMGDMADLKIISMSIGSPFGSSVLKDGVTYAYNKGKMVFAAAGTSFSWTSWWGVTYPAAYTQTYAVTGVNETGSTCNNCHDGSQVDFTIPMQRNSNTSRTSLSLSQSTLNPTYIGGSSASTATAAGIAALVWSVKPTLTRADVFTIMKNTAQFPGGSSNHGYGNVNAGAAVALAVTY